MASFNARWGQFGRLFANTTGRRISAKIVEARRFVSMVECDQDAKIVEAAAFANNINTFVQLANNVAEVRFATTTSFEASASDAISKKFTAMQ